MTRTLIAAGLAAASFVAVAPAAAEGDAFRIAVPADGLNLGTEQGQRALARRAVSASADVCGPKLTFRRLDEVAANECRDTVRASAKAEAARRGSAVQLASR